MISNELSVWSKKCLIACCVDTCLTRIRRGVIGCLVQLFKIRSVIHYVNFLEMDLELEKTLIIGEQIPCSVCCSSVTNFVCSQRSLFSLAHTILNVKRSCSIQVNSLHVNNLSFKMKLILLFVSQFLVNLNENLNHHIVYHEDNIN